MSVSKIHLSKFSNNLAVHILQIIESESFFGQKMDHFCFKLVNELNSGLTNDYTMIWDNYSVGGDQIDFTNKIFSASAKCSGKLNSSSWKVTFGYNFKSRFKKHTFHRPEAKAHRLILNALNVIPVGNDDLIVCMEEVLGPTIHDVDIDNMQKDFIAKLWCYRPNCHCTGWPNCHCKI